MTRAAVINLFAQAQSLARARDDSHGGHEGKAGTAYPGNTVRAHEIGAIGELWFAQTYGFPMPPLRTHGGDDGYDFLAQLPYELWARIDVKTLRKPRALIAPARCVIDGPANVYVMVHCDDNDCPHGIGWAHRSMMARAERFMHPTLGEQCAIPRARLRPLQDLERLLDMRLNK